MTSFYARFIPEYSKLAAPLHALKRKGVNFNWTELRQQAFDYIEAARDLISSTSSPRFWEGIFIGY
jgi:hypothetical protein